MREAGVVIVKQERRPCYVKFSMDVPRNAIFHKWVTKMESRPRSTYAGTLMAQESYEMALVEYHGGEIDLVEARRVVFTDGDDYEKFFGHEKEQQDGPVKRMGKFWGEGEEDG